MSNLYELDTVSELEQFEAGVDELPKSLVAKACSYFFVKDDFFDPACSIDYPFESFQLSVPVIVGFFDEGFSPI